MIGDENNHIHGSIEEVLAQLAEEVDAGHMTAAQLAEVAATLAQGHGEMHDISVGFRVALIMQGYEDMALHLTSVHMAMSKLGAMFAYSVRGVNQAEYMDSLDEGAQRALLVASVTVLRAGNVNATIAEDNLHIEIEGTITDDDDDDDVDSIVDKFVEELDEIFPEIPPSPPRQGDWW